MFHLCTGVSESSHRMLTLIGHIPWLARLITLIPGSRNDLENMKSCFERAIARKEKGAKQNDLFYYLVSTECSRSQVASQVARSHPIASTVRRTWRREGRNTIRHHHHRSRPCCPRRSRYHKGRSLFSLLLPSPSPGGAGKIEGGSRSVLPPRGTAVE